MRFLFVCTGNTCRSPMAEALARHGALRRGMTGHEFASAGLHIAPGSRASVEAVKSMASRSIDINRRPARQITKQMVRDADVVLVMTRGHACKLMHDMPEYASKVHTLGAYSGAGGDVADPWAGSPDEYKRVAATIEEMVTKLLDNMR